MSRKEAARDKVCNEPRIPDSVANKLDMILMNQFSIIRMLNILMEGNVIKSFEGNDCLLDKVEVVCNKLLGTKNKE